MYRNGKQRAIADNITKQMKINEQTKKAVNPFNNLPKGAAANETEHPSNLATVSVAVIVQSAAEVEAENKVLKVGREVVSAIGNVSVKYLDLVMLIRREKIMPKIVSRALLQLGFKKTRVSEVNRVAGASDAVFSQYEARMIGFENALDLARLEKKGEKAQLTPAGHLLLSDGVITQKEGEGVVHDLESDDKDTPPARKVKTLGQKLKEAATEIVVNSTKDKEWDFPGLGKVIFKVDPQRGAPRSANTGKKAAATPAKA